MIKTEKIENIIGKLKNRKSKNVIYAIVTGLAVFAFGYRFYAVAKENSFDVFNIIRNNQQHGTTVEVLKMKKTNGVLFEPLTIKNNRAYVSGARVSLFSSGQKIGDCKISYVSHDIDLDTSMHIIKTKGCSDGLQYVETKKIGFYVPVSALHGSAVYVVNDGYAQLRTIEIENRDAENALVKSGLNTDDIVILSHVQDNEKIRTEE